MTFLLGAFVDHPAAYGVVAVGVLAAFIALATWPAPRSHGRRAKLDVALCAVAAATVLAWRWPVFCSPMALNPDEGQMVANAIKATVDIVPWRGFDGTTSGPLNSDVLAVASLTGAHIDFFTARVIGVMLVVGALCALYFAIRWTYDIDVARIALVPPVLLFAFVRESDFVHYSSEHLSIFLVAVGLASSTYLLVGDGSARRRLCAAALGGVCIGCVPFAKLQAVPLAAVGCAFLATAIGFRRSASGPGWRGEALASAAGLGAPAVLILGSVVLAGEWNDFIISYVRFAALYVTGGAPIGPAYWLSSSPQYGAFLASVAIGIGGAAVVAAVRKPRFGSVPGISAAFSLCYVAASFFAIFEAHRPFPHYLLLSVIPLAWCAANAIGIGMPGVALPIPKRWVCAGFVLTATVLSLRPLSAIPDAFLRDLASSATWPRSPVAVAIGHYAKRGDVVAVWGWMPQYYVETGTIMATHDAHTYPQINPGPLREYFRARFMRDLAARPPRVIVDSVAPGAFSYTDNAVYGLDTFPPLAALVRERYALVQNVGGVRVFRLRQEAR